MDSFWQMVMGWNAFGQAIIFLAVLFLLFALIEQLLHYIAVIVRGWPDKFVQRGDLTVGHGQHEIQISTAMTPIEVWVNFDDGGCISVCQGDIDRVGVAINTDGFLLNCDIHSSERRLKWRAEF